MKVKEGLSFEVATGAFSLRWSGPPTQRESYLIISEKLEYSEPSQVYWVTRRDLEDLIGGLQWVTEEWGKLASPPEASDPFVEEPLPQPYRIEEDSLEPGREERIARET